MSERRRVDRRQPAPTPNSETSSWEAVLRDVKELREEHVAPAIWNKSDEIALEIYDQLIADMRARDAAGERKYGVRLQPRNGRDSLWDAYEEALDASVYLANYDAECGHHNHHGLSRSAIRLAFSIRVRIWDRDGR